MGSSTLLNSFAGKIIYRANKSNAQSAFHFSDGSAKLAA